MNSPVMAGFGIASVVAGTVALAGGVALFGLSNQSSEFSSGSPKARGLSYAALSGGAILTAGGIALSMAGFWRVKVAPNASLQLSPSSVSFGMSL